LISINPKIFLCFLYLFTQGLCVNLFSQSTSQGFKFKLTEGCDLIYRFNFSKADSLVNNLKLTHNNEPETYLLSANYYWWQIISGEDNPKNRKNYILNLEIASQKIKDKNEDEKLYALINIYAFKARIEGLNKNYLRAFSHINQSIDNIEKSFGREEKFEYFYLTSGLYNYYGATAEKHYPVLIPYLAFLPKSNKEKGLGYLNKCIVSKDVILQTEGNYFLMKIFMEENKPAKALNYADFLTGNYPSNLLYCYYRFKLFLDSNHKENAMKMLTALNVETIKNKQNLTESQQKHFLNLAKRDLEIYYKTKRNN